MKDITNLGTTISIATKINYESIWFLSSIY